MCRTRSKDQVRKTLGDSVMESAKSLIDGQEWDAAAFWAQKDLRR